MPKPQQSPTKSSPAGRKAIGLEALARHPGNRIRPPVLIVCEGKKTEQLYLNALRAYYRLSTVDITIQGEGAGPLEVVQRAIELAGERRRAARRERLLPYEEVWCVFDREASNEPADYREALNLADRHSIRLAISNPAFEYWYLLHFVETSRPFRDAAELLRELGQLGRLPGYQKSQNVFELLRDRTHLAHERAERLYAEHPDRHCDPYPNPCTLVHKLVGGISAMSVYGR